MNTTNIIKILYKFKLVLYFKFLKYTKIIHNQTVQFLGVHCYA